MQTGTMGDSIKDLSYLEEDEVSYFYSLLTEEITDFDCGTLCKGDNEGIPFCCSVENAVPFLYSAEFSYLKKRTDLWKVWKPVTDQQKELKKNNEDRSTIFCECKGVAYCERENRSISCRTFPMEPYIDRRGVIVGLVFMKEFTGGCPLTGKPEKIRQEYIDSSFLFWEKMLLRRPLEYDTYKKSSKAYRISRTKSGKNFPILYPSHLKDKTYLRKYV